MKKIILSIFSVFFTLTGFAQQQGQDTLYLKSGSRYIGKITVHTLEEKVEVKTADNEIHYFLKNDVFKISKSHVRVFKNNVSNDDIYPVKTNSTKTATTNKTLNNKTLDKSFLILEGSYGIGLKSESYNVKKIDLIGSYNISKYFNFGVGTGYRYYKSEYDSKKVIPLYADLRYLIRSFRNYKFLALDLGYSSDVTDSFYPLGYYVNPSFNMAFRAGNSTLLFLGIGYEIQNVRYLSENCNNIYLTIGFML
jgi:hypothetical protein